MAKQTILFQDGKTMIERENTVKQLLKCCESLDLDGVEVVIRNTTTFKYDNLPAFLVEVRIRLKMIKRQGITKLIASEEFINLTFFKQEIVNFTSTDLQEQFTLMFDVDGGIIRDVTIC